MDVNLSARAQPSLWIYRVLSYGLALFAIIAGFLSFIEHSQPAISNYLNSILTLSIAVCIFFFLQRKPKISFIISGAVLIISLIILLSELMNSAAINSPAYASTAVPFHYWFTHTHTLLILIASGMLAINRQRWPLLHTLLTGVFLLALFGLTHMLLYFESGISMTKISLSLLSAGLICLFLEKGRHHFSLLERYGTYILGFCLMLSLTVLCLEIYALEQLHSNRNTITWLIASAGTSFILLLSILLHVWRDTMIEKNKIEQLLDQNDAILEAAADGLIAFNQQGRIIYYNQNFLKMWQHLPAELHTMNIFQLFEYIGAEAKSFEHIIQKIKKCMQFDSIKIHEEILLDNGLFYLVNSRSQMQNGQIFGHVLSFLDISDIKVVEKKLAHYNTHDTLTNLPNRALLPDLIQFALETNSPQHKVGIVILDIDRMATINDVFGIVKGDDVIKKVAERINIALPDNSSLCRFGGDEFVIIVHDVTHPLQLKKQIEQLLVKVSCPISIEEITFNITFSIGISLSPDHSSIKEELLRMADIALIQAKKMGRNSIAMYSPQFNAHTLKKMQLENDLYVAISEQQFILVYQPIFNLMDLSIIGVEALIRWKHPKRGILLPDYFIPLAEEINLIHQISKWVLNESCQQLAQWRKRGIHDLKMAVNIAAPQFHEHKLLDLVSQVIQSSGITPQCLELELIERTILDGDPEIYNTLKVLNEQGINLSLDDFGTGYSSLSYLKRFPISKLKIDKSFISDLINSEENKKLVKTIISMAKSLNMQVLAEGIEDSQQLAFLQKNGCEQGQGYYLAHPMLADECYQFICKTYQRSQLLHQQNN